MAQRGRGMSDWQQRLAAQQREAEAARRAAERQAREQARLAKQQEKAAKELHIAEQERTAEEKSAAVATQVAALDDVLSCVLELPPFGFHRLEVVAATPVFDPGRLGVAAVAPDWADCAPVEPQGLGRWFGGVGRYQQQLAAARTQWEAATTEFERAEADRMRVLAAAKDEHDRQVARAQAQAAAHNADISARRAAFTSGDTEAVEWFVGQVLQASRYPQGFPSRYQVAYRPQNRDVVVEFELPPQQVVPDVREYRYIKGRDTINPVPRPPGEVKQRYAQLVARMALRTSTKSSPRPRPRW